MSIMSFSALSRAIVLALMLSTAPVEGNSAANRTADSKTLKTWWHETGEINTKTPVQDGNVRQSHLYSIQVSDGKDFYDSFVYESIPRNGNGKICTPGDLTSICDVDDSITIEPDVGVDMAWTQYLSSRDTIVRVTRANKGSIHPANVVIRPDNLSFKLEASDDALLIHVPYSETGHRFSVEFHDNLWEYRNAAQGLGSYYVQDKNPDADSYTSKYTDSMPIVGLEPLNALLVFMSPFPSSEYVPDLKKDVYAVPQGLVKDLTQVTESTLYFAPGVYWFTGTNHAILSSSISWVYIAPGAYVKGAIEYNSDCTDLRATGFGVLSGEQYVYQANTAEDYKNIKSDTDSLKMWRGKSATGTTWTIHGLTTNAPPFNSMDFYGDADSFSVDASDYKQVGAFFGQTDGIEMYPGSYVRDVFYHIGDDGIKTYYSDVLCERVTIWKTRTAPIVQLGWYPRDVNNVTVHLVDIIHTRYLEQETPYPRALVGSAASYVDVDSTSTANISTHLTNFTFSNWRCEVICPAILAFNPLSNIDTMKFSNIRIQKFGPRSTEIGLSTIRVFTDADNGNQDVAIGDNSPDNLGIVIENFYVNNEKISFEANNWDADSAGHLHMNSHWDGRWTVR